MYVHVSATLIPVTHLALGGVGIRIVRHCSGRLGLISTAQYPGHFGIRRRNCRSHDWILAVILTLLLRLVLVAACAVHLSKRV